MKHILAALLCFASIATLTAAQNPTVIARDGKAALSIVVPDNASVETSRIAGVLGDYLEKISGAAFTISDGKPSKGIFLSVVSGNKIPILKREDYTIKTAGGSLSLSGNSEQGLEHAVWDLLRQLGHRQFFPGPTWEIIPRQRNLSIDLNLSETPDYNYRRIWPGYGFWGYNKESWEDWDRKNRTGGAFNLRTGHAYGRIIRAKQAVFDAHPEFHALVDGKRHVVPHAKFCIGNPALRKTVVDYALEYFEKDPSAECVSMDPSDGGNWCECAPCRKIGPPSDRALTLANEVAAAVNRENGPARFVGMYAYNDHSPPPSLQAHPRVLINAATAFIKGGKRIEDIISGWSEKGAAIGIREYYSVHPWDRDMPGVARGARLDYLGSTISDFHRRGARFLTSEASDNWGCNGLGYYFASRVLWNTNAANQKAEIVDDFLTLAFGPAKEPMRKFYETIDGDNPRARLILDDQLGRMFRSLQKARRMADSKEIRARIDDLTLYARYVELFDRYRSAQGEARKAAFESVVRHAWRMRRTQMVHTLALYRDVPARDKAAAPPENARWTVPPGKNPWKIEQPFRPSELRQFLADGIAKHPLTELDFEPRAFSNNLAPLQNFRSFDDLSAGKAEQARGTRSWYTFASAPPTILELRITGGLIKHYRDRGNIDVTVWKIGGASQTGERETLVASDRSVPPDGVERVVRLKLKEPGLHRIDLSDGNDLTRVTWPDHQIMSWKMTLEEKPHSMSGRWNLYFYAPRGTRKIGLFAAAAQGGKLLRPDGSVALEFKTTNGEFLSVDVPAGADDALWKLQNYGGKISLLNVPPYLAHRPEQLLTPKEAVQTTK